MKRPYNNEDIIYMTPTEEKVLMAIFKYVKKERRFAPSSVIRANLGMGRSCLNNYITVLRNKKLIVKPECNTRGLYKPSETALKWIIKYK